MNEALYERYKQALRSGHVAVLRGQLDMALEAYREAARVAVGRPLPYTSLGGVLLRLGRLTEALEAFEHALAIAPRDEPGLIGLADALVAARRRGDAAEALDRLANVQAEDGRLPEAVDTLRRALELADVPARRVAIGELAARIRSTAGDRAAEEALGRALHLLDASDTALGSATDARPPVATTGAPPAAHGATHAPPDAVPTPGAGAAPARPVADVGPLAEAAFATNDPGARSLLVELARAYRVEGLPAAAFDACQRALAIAPDDPDLHLALAGLYLDLGWRELAGTKLVLLGRLLELTGDDAGRDRLCGLVKAAFPGDPRFAALCA